MAEEKKGLIAEFQEFINKGNAMDMAVGVIIGGAFTAIVTSLTTDIINPLITLLSGGTAGADGIAIPLTIAGFNIGSFLSAVIIFDEGIISDKTVCHVDSLIIQIIFITFHDYSPFSPLIE